MFALKLSVLLLVVGVALGAPWHDGKHDHCHYKDVVIYNYRHYLPADECVRLECYPTEKLKRVSCQDAHPDEICEKSDDMSDEKFKVIFPDCCKCKPRTS